MEDLVGRNNIEESWTLDENQVQGNILNTKKRVSQLSAKIENYEKKVEYIKNYFYPKLYEAIWEKWVLSESMTIDKLKVIGTYLSIWQIIAIWWENLVHEWMSPEKIKIIWGKYTPDDILWIWWARLAKMSYIEVISAAKKIY